MTPPNDTPSTATPPIVVIVGRPNVGKSTLFNRIAGERIAITADEPGTTRDRLFASAEWDDRAFMLVDTGGLEANPEASIGRAIRAQVHAAIDEADAVIFLTDVTTGITPADEDVAEVLRRCGKPVALGVNKVDSGKRELQTPEFYSLGLGEPLPVSAHHNQGVGTLLDAVLETLLEAEAPPPVQGVGLAIVGRPNTGKSSLLNALLGEERAIVSDIPGTTRDAVDTVIEYKGQPITVIDTAGVRKRGRVSRGVERFSVLRALRAVERADVTVLLLDASELDAAQDAHIAGFALDAYKGVVIAVNKWDLARGLEIDQAEAEGIVRRQVQVRRLSAPGVHLRDERRGSGETPAGGARSLRAAADQSRDRRPQQDRRPGGGRAPSPFGGAQAAPYSVRYAVQREPANLRLLRQRREVGAFFVSPLLREPHPGGVRVHGDAVEVRLPGPRRV